MVENVLKRVYEEEPICCNCHVLCSDLVKVQIRTKLFENQIHQITILPDMAKIIIGYLDKKHDDEWAYSSFLNIRCYADFLCPRCNEIVRCYVRLSDTREADESWTITAGKEMKF